MRQSHQVGHGIQRRPRHHEQRQRGHAQPEQRRTQRRRAEHLFGQHRPQDQHQPGVDELQHMTAAPEQAFIGVGDIGARRQRDPGQDEAHQGHQIDQPAHGGAELQRPPQAARPGEQAQHRERHADPQQAEADIVERMNQHRHIIVQRRPALVQQGRHQQQQRADPGEPQPGAPHAGQCRPVAAGPRRGDHRQGAEHRQVPDHHREHHMGDQCGIEEGGRIPRHVGLGIGCPAQAEQQCQRPRHRQRSDRQQGPAAQFAAQRVAQAAGKGRHRLGTGPPDQARLLDHRVTPCGKTFLDAWAFRLPSLFRAGCPPARQISSPSHMVKHDIDDDPGDRNIQP